VDLLAAFAPDEQTRTKILVDNPAVLYGFAWSGKAPWGVHRQMEYGAN
jgi:hypothetical protein